MFLHNQDYFKDLKEELKLWDELQKKSKNKEVNEEICQWIGVVKNFLKIHSKWLFRKIRT